MLSVIMALSSNNPKVPKHSYAAIALFGEHLSLDNSRSTGIARIPLLTGNYQIEHSNKTLKEHLLETPLRLETRNTHYFFTSTLGTTGTSASLAEPVLSEAKEIIVMLQGTVYNYIELANAINYPVSPETTDTDVITAYLERKQLDIFTRAVGSFTCVWKNLQEKVLHIVSITDGPEGIPIYCLQTNYHNYISTSKEALAQIEYLLQMEGYQVHQLTKIKSNEISIIESSGSIISTGALPRIDQEFSIERTLSRHSKLTVQKSELLITKEDQRVTYISGYYYLQGKKIHSLDGPLYLNINGDVCRKDDTEARPIFFFRGILMNNEEVFQELLRYDSWEGISLYRRLLGKTPLPIPADFGYKGTVRKTGVFMSSSDAYYPINKIEIIPFTNQAVTFTKSYFVKQAATKASIGRKYTKQLFFTHKHI